MEQYICGGFIWESYELAVEYSNFMYEKQGIILGIEKMKEELV